MKLFFIVDGNGDEMVNVIDILHASGHQVLYWSGLDTRSKTIFPNTIFHSHFDARKNIPTTYFNILNFPPVSHGLIKKMASTEVIMQSLYAKDFPGLPLENLRHIYYDMLRYWYGVINEFKPDAVVFTVMPHHMYNYVIYALAKEFRIKIIFFEDTWVSDRALVYNDLWQGSYILQKQIEEDRDHNFTIDDLSKDIQEYLKKQKSKKSIPLYMRDQKKKYTGLAVWRKRWEIIFDSIIKFTLFKIFYQSLRKRLTDNLQKEYLEIEIKPDLKKNFVYVPLNYQPERTTSPQGDTFVDQILMVETLSAALPEDWVIYVKDHPTQWWRDGLNYTHTRYKGYYKKIASLRNVFLVPVFTNSNILINHSRAVATVTGSAGFEALLNSKPVLVFGYPWYRDCPGLFRTEDVVSARNALLKIKNRYKVDKQKIINYLHSLDKATIHCIVDDFDNPMLSAYTRSERINNYAQAVLRELSRITYKT